MITFGGAYLGLAAGGEGFAEHWQELLMLTLEHFSPVFKLLYKALGILWLLANLIQ